MNKETEREIEQNNREGINEYVIVLFLLIKIIIYSSKLNYIVQFRSDLMQSYFPTKLCSLIKNKSHASYDKKEEGM